VKKKSRAGCSINIRQTAVERVRAGSGLLKAPFFFKHANPLLKTITLRERGSGHVLFFFGR
jgi:hypothetical protein